MPSPAILIVEDEQLIRMHLGDLASELGYSAIEAQSVAEAIAVLESRNDVRVLFADVRLADGSNGAQLAAEVARRWPAIRLIVASGYGEPEQLPASATFIRKPFSVGHLRQIMIGQPGRTR